MLNKYFQDLFNTTRTGDATEESYYPDLKRLVENYSQEKNKKFFAVPLPKRTEAGNPDFRIWDGKQHIVGYIEAKKPEINLETIESSEQLKRYRSTFPNLILTNFFEFRLYRNGQKIARVITGRPFIIHELKAVPPVENEQEFLKLLDQFFSFSISKTYTAKQLAIELAKRTRFLRDQVIAEELKEEKTKDIQTLQGFHKAFKDHLISSLTHKDFSNLFAQTITYGLFAARSRAENGFNRKLAHDLIPHTIGILRRVFKFISSADLSQSMEWIIDDIAEVLAVAKVKKIIHGFYKKGKDRDPIIHFYETFLAEYDPKEREKRGVYYTPEPVVSYIVRSVHQLLKDKFNKEDGFADQSVTVLDPAAGTLTFPARAIKEAVEEYQEKYGSGGIKGLIKDHILKNFYAFELMMAPYAVGHLKIGFLLDELKYKLSDEERFKLYLTNTLDFTKEDPNRLPGVFEREVAKESKDALKVKEEVSVMVIIGNPPYSGVSENKGKWILDQIKQYRQIEGKSLGERNPKWLQDDYVKFIRFSQWKIEKSGVGILGFITNHAWLDNPTFRGMRYSLLKTFDEIYILNLHGSTLKKEQTPDGGKDENVFDIQPGVSIMLAIKNSQSKTKQLFYADQWGLRQKKYDWLEKHDIKNTKWQKIKPANPDYFFIKRDTRGWTQYKNFIKVTDIFPVNSVGIVTSRDNFVIDFDKNALRERIRVFRDSNNDNEFIKNAYGLMDKPNWTVRAAREKLRKEKNWEGFFQKILYRPFDERWIYYHPAVIERHRDKVMSHLLKFNLALITAKRNRLSDINSFFCSDKLVETKCGESTIQSYTFPLYRYHSKLSPRLWDSEDKQGIIDFGSIRELNIASKILGNLEIYFKKTPNAEAIFYYIYAVLYSNVYRKKYQEFLKIDFPRIPFTKDYKLFKQMAILGEKLANLHLFKSPELDYPIAKFQGKNSNLVEKRDYDEKQKRVYINDQQYFEGITPEVWNYYIGGYQVLDKWLKDRKGRHLSAEDVKHYCRVVTTLSETIKIQEKIDKFYLKLEIKEKISDA